MAFLASLGNDTDWDTTTPWPALLDSAAAALLSNSSLGVENGSAQAEVAVASGPVQTPVTRTALVVSGTFFGVTAAFLIFRNQIKLDIANAPLDMRLNSSLKICTFICMFSCFFNFFQLTELDDLVIPASRAYILDLARPVEWIMTCPLLQLVVCIIAGPFIPGYRLYMMPFLSFLVLVLGVVAVSFNSSTPRSLFFLLSFFICMFMFWFNRKQILEATDGEEDLHKGWSSVRLLSVFLILTWFPFPVWFFLSPEGFDYIQSFQVVQVGWNVLNILAKGGFVAIVQWFKAKFERECDFGFEVNDTEEGAPRNVEYLDLHRVLEDTMEFLGMTPRLQELKRDMRRAKVKSCLNLYEMTEAKCKEVNLPWGIVFAAKRRMYTVTVEDDKEHEKGFEGMEHVHDLLCQGLSSNMAQMKKVLQRVEEHVQDEGWLNLCRTRLAEVRNWHALYSYIESGKSFQQALEGQDPDDVALAVEASAAAGFDVSKARDHLDNITRRRRVCKNAMKAGNTCFRQGKFEEALEKFSSVLEEDEEHSDALINRSATFARMERWEEAERDAARCVEAHPLCEKAYHKQATALVNMGRAHLAVGVLVKGTSRLPNSKALQQLHNRTVLNFSDNSGVQTQTEPDPELGLGPGELCLPEIKHSRGIDVIL